MRWLLYAVVMLGSALTPSSEAGAAPGASQGALVSLDACERLVRRSPDDMKVYNCYRLAARLQPQAAVLRLESRHSLDPSNPGVLLHLGLIEWDQGKLGRVESLLRAATAECASRNSAEGIVYSRLSLARFFSEAKRIPEMDAEVQEAARIADASGDQVLVARVLLARGVRAYYQNDYSQAYSLYKQAEAKVFPDGPFDMRAGVLGGLGSIAWATGKYREGLDYYTRAAQARHEEGDAFSEATHLYNVALLAARLQSNGEMPMEEVRRLMSQAIESAQQGGNRSAEASVRRLMAQDPGLSYAVRIEHAGRALEIARFLHDEPNLCSDLRLMANLRFNQDHTRLPEVMRLSDEAIGRARAIGDRRQTALGLVARAGNFWRGNRPDEATPDFLAALDEIEAIRDLQRDDLVRARFFSEWSFLYYRFSGRLLDDAGATRAQQQLELPFQVAERLRARVLLDNLDAAGSAATLAPKGPTREKREALLEQIAQVQRRLTSPGLSATERTEALAELERHEVQELALREEMAGADPRFAALRRPRFPTIDELRQALGQDEAMLAFQLSTRREDAAHWYYNGGSWLFVITAGSARVIPLADSDELEQAVKIYLGLLKSRDRYESDAAARLYDRLLAGALADLPAGITRLVVIPDGILHRLPFDALRPRSQGEPLVSRYEISLAPSATTWLRWRGAVSRATLPVIAVADPILDQNERTASVRGGSPWSEGLKLGPLPYAREEATSLVQQLGRGSLLLAGGDASERHLKDSDLAGYKILHFAVHAVADERRPERSAVVLSPGSDKEDGLLQMREVIGLPLDGQLVVLAACNSASGELVGGEGFLGLARSFFQAGARSVVGSLWPLRDKEASELIDAFYGYLGSGMSVAGAMARARRDRIQAGDAPADWAGLQVFGDGDLIPFPAGAVAMTAPTRVSMHMVLPGVLLAAALVGLYLGLFRTAPAA